MGTLRFEWDEAKNITNRRKHDVGFEEAATVFSDDFARLAPDPDHSLGEERFVLLGMSRGFRLLIVCHCEREPDLIRIMSARRPISTSASNMRISSMRDHYDFSKSKPNPYARRMKKQVTIRLDESTIAYFRKMAEEKGIPYQSLINLYLRDCAASQRNLKLKWA